MIPKLELRNLSKSFQTNGRNIEALSGISLQVDAGEFVTLVGPSGSGKSTLFNLIAGLLEPDKGEVWLDGQLQRERTGNFGYMPQRDLLFPWRSVTDNVAIPLELVGVNRGAARERAQEMLVHFGLEEFGGSYPSALSGGMRQRAALLRTILTEQDVLLLDEPFGALDALTRRELQDWLLEVWQEYSKTLFFITHDVEEALYLSDRVVVLSARPGHIVEILNVNLPRPRRPGMIARPDFGQQAAVLLKALGIRD
ncbi:MAG: ABC transporter ATP-binding protein [Chloroflexi bacterium]|nr:ABC transporter ATP-binding protein [Chloroflexota bacterium]